jgi:uncharacterized phage-associated protein
MEYKSIILAKYIAAYLNNKNIDMNMTKIQKLTYIAYGTYLAIKDERLTDEHPQAWPFGPVFPRSRTKLQKINLYSISLSAGELSVISSDEILVSIMESIFNTFGHWTASKLSGWSHKEGSPWEKTVSKTGFKWGDRINDDDIKAYFKKIVNYQANETENRLYN